MDISMFNEPITHPWETFEKMETETFMWWFFKQCFDAGDLDATIATPNNEDHLVEMGLLSKVGERQYRLTTKSKGILYSVYGKAAQQQQA